MSNDVVIRNQEPCHLSSGLGPRFIVDDPSDANIHSKFENTTLYLSRPQCLVVVCTTSSCSEWNWFHDCSIYYFIFQALSLFCLQLRKNVTHANDSKTRPEYIIALGSSARWRIIRRALLMTFVQRLSSEWNSAENSRELPSSFCRFEVIFLTNIVVTGQWLACANCEASERVCLRICRWIWPVAWNSLILREPWISVSENIFFNLNCWIWPVTGIILY